MQPGALSVQDYFLRMVIQDHTIVWAEYPFMVHLHCRRRTQIRIQTPIPVLYRSKDWESESESVPEYKSVSRNVNES